MQKKRRASQGTPSQGATRPMKPPASKSHAKRQRLAGARGFFSPPLGVRMHAWPRIAWPGSDRHPCMQETPAGAHPVASTSGKDSVWPTSAQRKFECLAVYTPVDGLHPEPGTAGGTSGAPSHQGAGEEEHIELQDDDDGFILFSQNDYVRGSQAVGTPEPEAQKSDDTQAASTSFFAFTSQASILQDPGATMDGHMLHPFSQPTQPLGHQATVTSNMQLEATVTQSGFQLRALSEIVGAATDAAPSGSAAAAAAAPPAQQRPREKDAAAAAAAPGASSHHHPMSLCIPEEDLNLGSQPSASGAGGTTTTAALGPAGRRESADSHDAAVTPELGSGSSIVVVAKSDEATSSGLASAARGGGPQKMFNIFLPRNVQRHLLIIRHGESEFNRAMLEGKDFKDPQIFDPSLTARGITQSRALRAKLRQQLALHGDALWVISPLRRTLQTFLEACPLLHQGDGDSPASGSGSGAAGAGPQSLALARGGVAEGLNIEVLPTISEFVVTTGDVGSPASALAREFPMLAKQFAKLPEQWCFQGAKKLPNCAASKQFHATEPKDHRQKRVAELARWLSSRTERFIIMIGHCSFWHEFRGKTERRMDNGELRCMHW